MRTIVILGYINDLQIKKEPNYIYNCRFIIVANHSVIDSAVAVDDYLYDIVVVVAVVFYKTHTQLDKQPTYYIHSYVHFIEHFNSIST